MNSEHLHSEKLTSFRFKLNMDTLQEFLDLRT
jgi:hypothetical protein